MLLDEAGMHRAGGEGRMAGERDEEVAVGPEAGDAAFLERADQPAARRLAVLAPGDQLRDQRVVVDADLVA